MSLSHRLDKKRFTSYEPRDTKYGRDQFLAHNFLPCLRSLWSNILQKLVKERFIENIEEADLKIIKVFFTDVFHCNILDAQSPHNTICRFLVKLFCQFFDVGLGEGNFGSLNVWLFYIKILTHIIIWKLLLCLHFNQGFNSQKTRELFFYK